MAKKYFCKKLSLDPIPGATDDKDSEALITGTLLNTNSESTCHVSFKESPKEVQSEDSTKEWGLFEKKSSFNPKEIDLNTDVTERKIRQINFVARKRSSIASYDENEITIDWFHRDKSQIFQKTTLDPKESSENSRAKLQSFGTAGACETFPVDVDELSDSEKTLTNSPPSTKPTPIAAPEASAIELADSDDSENTVIYSPTVSSQVTPHSPVHDPPLILPLVPDFTEFVNDPEVDIDDLNLSEQDRHRTKVEFTKSSHVHTGHRSVGQCLPKEIRKKMWSDPADSDSSQNFTTESSDTECPPVQSTSHVNQQPRMSHNMSVLKRKPLNQAGLAKIREKVRVDLSNIKIEEPATKKPKIEKIEWDIGAVRPQDKFKARRDTISEELKRLRIQSDNSADDFSPTKRLVIDSTGPSRRFIDVPHVPSQRRVIRTAVRRSPPPPVAIKKEPIQDRLKLVAKRQNSFTRRCRICWEPHKNLRSHVCLDHLGRPWWGVVGDLTCWTCQMYHTPSEITKCDGTFIPLFHKETFIARHMDFMTHLTEEFGVNSPQEVLNKVKKLGLNSRCVSDFTEREIAFLAILDTHYGLLKKDRYSARYPDRVVEILHWKTLSEIFCYLQEAGNLRGSRRCTISASVVDTRCDVVTLKTQQMHDGPLCTLEFFQKDLRCTKLQKVICEVHDPATPITTLLKMLKDPMVRLAIGVIPQHAHHVKAGYYLFCKLQIKHNNLVAIGGLGLDRSVPTASMSKQKEVMIDFMNIAKNNNKAIRLLSTGDMALSIQVAKDNLLKKHPVHLLNYSRGPEEIKDFLDHFPNGFIGISSKVSDPSPEMLSTLETVPLNRLVVESNCPHQAINFHAKAKPTDVVTVMNIIARIRCMNPVLVSRVIRTNVTRLYHF